jgi:hypothetical protein
MRPLACAVLLLAVAAAPCAARPGVAVLSCAQQSGNDDFVAGADDLTVGPLAMLGLRRAEDLTAASMDRLWNGFWKSPALLRPGHRATIRIARRSRDVARLAWDNNDRGPEFVTAPHTVRFRACPASRAQSIADGRPVTFWSGGLLLNALPACVHLTVRIDRRTPRRLRLPVGADGCS